MRRQRTLWHPPSSSESKFNGRPVKSHCLVVVVGEEEEMQMMRDPQQQDVVPPRKVLPNSGKSAPKRCTVAAEGEKAEMTRYLLSVVAVEGGAVDGAATVEGIPAKRGINEGGSMTMTMPKIETSVEITSLESNAPIAPTMPMQIMILLKPSPATNGAGMVLHRKGLLPHLEAMHPNLPLEGIRRKIDLNCS